VTAEIEQLENRLAGRPAFPVGTWDLVYTNGARHTCRIASDGTWEKVAAPDKRPTRMRLTDAHELVVIHRDGDIQKAERYHVTTDGLLIVEHFNPSTALGKGAAHGDRTGAVGPVR